MSDWLPEESVLKNPLREVERLSTKVVPTLHRDIIALQSRLTAAEKFKTFVHSYMDKHGVPHGDPENQHQKEGCRIGARLDLMFAQITATEKERDELKHIQEHGNPKLSVAIAELLGWSWDTKVPGAWHKEGEGWRHKLPSVPDMFTELKKERDEARADHAGCVTRWREALTNPIPSPGVMREPVESLYRQTEALRTKLDEALARVKELGQTNLRIREYNYNADLKIELLEEQVRSLTSVLEDGPTAKQKGVRAELDKLKGTK